ncbi:hypothetical protein JBKA6_0987 [Ichthyobacterium seriolicida]|uniref:DUF1573 domain-containing protein n=2 Tax=Ichthyobacterium seriolicida TaxID=242600 RepID=A0A1J1EBW3_9FLAO|nr:hypothetical protein JBKA6_0987 [Ichthyobacterium seriolicida]
MIDYGTIDKGASGVRYFNFTNKGSSPLIISDVKSSCGCTVPTPSKEPVMPGKSGKIEVSYDTHRIGVFNKHLTVISNSQDRDKIFLNIKGEVLAPKEGDEKKKKN